jgi:hypothetical protein
VASTVPANGDVNPYGVALVPATIGRLEQGHILVSNFNNHLNQQGTGTTIVDVSPTGAVSLFAEINPAKLPGPCPGGVGLTTALVVLQAGWVIVGSLPTTDGTSATAQPGCLIVLNRAGEPVETFFGSLLNGPWDMTAVETPGGASLFVTNVLNGTQAADSNPKVPGGVVRGGTVVRINLQETATQVPSIESMTIVASGFGERTDPSALVIGPTGVGVSPACGSGHDCKTILGPTAGRVLYVADTVGNRIQAIPNAMDGQPRPGWASPFPRTGLSRPRSGSSWRETATSLWSIAETGSLPSSMRPEPRS